jgi:hypothetical protein
MIYFLALIPATALTVAGYFVLYLASRSEGALRTFGRYLGFWAFTLAGLVILGALFAAAHHAHRGMHPGMYGMHDRMHCPWSAEERPLGPRALERRELMERAEGEPHAPAPPPAEEPKPAPTPAPSH